MPTPEETRQFIKTIPEQVKTLPYNKVVELCNHFFPAIPLLQIDSDNTSIFNQREYGGRKIIQRGRRITNSKNQPYRTVSEISHIPVNELNKITSFGRANKTGESMFYGSSNFATACIETLGKGTDFKETGSAMVTIGNWEIVESLKLVQVPYSLSAWKQLNENTTTESKKITEEYINKQNDDMRKLFQRELDFEILELFGNAFAKLDIQNDSDYFLSNYYIDRIFNRIEGFSNNVNIDGVIYPSVPNSYQENNIVLKPEIVNTKLKFVNGMQIWTLHDLATGGNTTQFIPIEQKIKADNSGKLLWGFEIDY